MVLKQNFQVPLLISHPQALSCAPFSDYFQYGVPFFFGPGDVSGSCHLTKQDIFFQKKMIDSHSVCQSILICYLLTPRNKPNVVAHNNRLSHHFAYNPWSNNMNRQPNDRELNSNTSVNPKKVEEPNLKEDSLMAAFHANAQSSVSSTVSTQGNSSSSSASFQDSRSSLESQERVAQRVQMTEQYLLKALNLDRR